MTENEIRDYHWRIAARLRDAAATATSELMRSRLLEKAREHERIARGERKEEHTALHAA